MADEITLNQRLRLTNGELLDDNNPGAISVTQTTQVMFKRVIIVGTSEESVTFTDVTTPGICYLRNLDGTNYVQWGVATTVYTGRILANDIPACFRLDNGATTLYMKANTASVKLLVTVYDL